MQVSLLLFVFLLQLEINFTWGVLTFLEYKLFSSCAHGVTWNIQWAWSPDIFMMPPLLLKYQYASHPHVCIFPSSMNLFNASFGKVTPVVPKLFQISVGQRVCHSSFLHISESFYISALTVMSSSTSACCSVLLSVLFSFIHHSI